MSIKSFALAGAAAVPAACSTAPAAQSTTIATKMAIEPMKINKLFVLATIKEGKTVYSRK
jgi:hypothetical protein